MTSNHETNRDKVLRGEAVPLSDGRLRELQKLSISAEGIGYAEYHWHWAAMVNELIARRASETNDWRLNAAEWLRKKAAKQEQTNAECPEHAAAYQAWRNRPLLLRMLADEMLLRPTEKTTIVPTSGASSTSEKAGQILEAFIAGARWARMAAENAYDEKLLEEDSSHYIQTGTIRCRGDGSIQHVKRTMRCQHENEWDDRKQLYHCKKCDTYTRGDEGCQCRGKHLMANGVCAHCLLPVNRGET